MDPTHLDNPIPDQEQALLECYRFIRQRAAWLRAQNAAACQPPCTSTPGSQLVVERLTNEGELALKQTNVKTYHHQNEEKL